MLEVGLWVILGLVLLGLEVFIISFGILTLAAVSCFYLSFQMARQEVLLSPPWRLQVLAGVIVTGILFLAYLAHGSWQLRHRRRSKTQEEALVIHLDSANAGQVDWHGERWRFQSKQPVAMGDKVRIERVEGLLVWCEKL
jgi:membrane-bound serine protease (ClpP class)